MLRETKAQHRTVCESCGANHPPCLKNFLRPRKPYHPSVPVEARARKESRERRPDWYLHNNKYNYNRHSPDGRNLRAMVAEVRESQLGMGLIACLPARERCSWDQFDHFPLASARNPPVALLLSAENRSLSRQVSRDFAAHRRPAGSRHRRQR